MMDILFYLYVLLSNILYNTIYFEIKRCSLQAGDIEHVTDRNRLNADRIIRTPKSSY